MSATTPHRAGRRATVVAGAALGIVGLTAGAALAYWTTTGAGTGTATSSTLKAPTGVSATTAGVVSWTASSTSGAIAPSSYLVERSSVANPDNQPRSWSTSCTTSGTSCTDAAFPTAPGTYRFVYRSTARYNSAWTAVSTESALVTVTVAAPGPAAPTGVSLTNGLGDSSAWINNTNKGSVNFSVTLPASSSASDVVHLTVGDGVAGHLVTATNQAGTSGAGTVSFNALNLTGLNDGTLTVTAWVTNASGTSTSATASPAKDVVAPTLSAITVANNGDNSNGKVLSGTASTPTSHPGAKTPVSASVTGTGCTITPTTAAVNATSGAWSGPAVSLSRNTSCTATVTQADTAGNVATQTATVNRT